MDRVVELEQRRDAALELIAAAIAEVRVRESARLSDEIAELRTGLEAAEAALESRTRELEDALRSLEEAEARNAVPDEEPPDEEPPESADGGELLQAVRVLEGKLDDLSERLAEFGVRIDDIAGPERDESPESDAPAAAARDGESGDFQRLRRMREKDLAEVNAILEQLAPLVDGG